MEDTVRERLIKFIEFKRISQYKFTSLVGLSMGYVNNIGLSISRLSQAKIEDKFPELNMKWLLTGEGDMLNSTEPNQQTAEDIIVNEASVLSQLHRSHQITIATGEEESTDLKRLQIEINKMRSDISSLKKIVKEQCYVASEKDKLLAEKDILIAEKERLIQLLMNRPKLTT